MKREYLREIRGKVYGNGKVRALFSLGLDTVERLVELIGTDFERNMVEDIYHYFLYLLKPFLILKQYLSQEYKTSPPVYQLALSRLKSSQEEEKAHSPLKQDAEQEEEFDRTYRRLYGRVSIVIG